MDLLDGYSGQDNSKDCAKVFSGEFNMEIVTTEAKGNTGQDTHPGDGAGGLENQGLVLPPTWGKMGPSSGEIG